MLQHRRNPCLNCLADFLYEGRAATLLYRPRDLLLKYDAYILATTQKFDQAVFENALQATANHRDTARQIEDVPGILQNIEESPELKTMWERYRKQFTYAAGIEYEQIINVLKTLLGINAIAKREAPVTDK